MNDVKRHYRPNEFMESGSIIISGTMDSVTLFMKEESERNEKIQELESEIERLKKENVLMKNSLSNAHSYLVATYNIPTWKDEPEYAMMKNFEKVLKQLSEVDSE